MRITTHQATSTISLPVTVTYICEHCHAPNEDRNQVLSVVGNSHASVIGVSDGMRESATRNAESAYQSLINDLNQKKYKKANLTCKCTSCGKSPSWSSFIKKPLGISLIAFIVGIFMVIAFLSNVSDMDPQKISWGMVVISFLAVLPFPILTIIYSVEENKASKLEDAYLPHFTIRQK